MKMDEHKLGFTIEKITVYPKEKPPPNLNDKLNAVTLADRRWYMNAWPCYDALPDVIERNGGLTIYGKDDSVASVNALWQVEAEMREIINENEHRDTGTVTLNP